MANEPRESQPERGAKPDGQAAPKSLGPQPFREQSPGRASSDVSLTPGEWKERAGLEFGSSPHAVAGALAHHDPDAEVSRADVQAALDEFSVRRGV